MVYIIYWSYLNISEHSIYSPSFLFLAQRKIPFRFRSLEDLLLFLIRLPQDRVGPCRINDLRLLRWTLGWCTGPHWMPLVAAKKNLGNQYVVPICCSNNVPVKTVFNVIQWLVPLWLEATKNISKYTGLSENRPPTSCVPNFFFHSNCFFGQKANHFCTWLVVDLPLWKMMDFFSWDDDISNISHDGSGWCWYICKHKWGILMGSMLPYIAAPWILWVWKVIKIHGSKPPGTHVTWCPRMERLCSRVH